MDKTKTYKLNKDVYLNIEEFNKKKFFFINTPFGKVILKEKTAKKLYNSLKKVFK